MAKRLTISTIGSPPPRLIEGGPAQLLDRMRDHWRGRIVQVLPDRPDLIVLPEFSDQFAEHSAAAKRDYALAAGTRMLEYFQETARRERCFIAYPTFVVAEDGTTRNRTRLLDRDGQVVGSYDKYHLTPGEIEGLSSRTEVAPRVIECELGRIACLTCFDLNFDDLRLQYVAARPDLLLFSSLFHGGLMQAYWAYSCRCHFVSSIGHPGLLSGILSPSGKTLASTTIYFDFATAHINLDCRLAHLDHNWEKLRALKQHYGKAVTITDPDLMGSVLITSESDDRSAMEMIREFGIELLDDYLVRAQECQRGARVVSDAK